MLTIREFNVKSENERIRSYRRYVYEAGAITRPVKMQAKLIDDKVVAKERKNEFRTLICQPSSEPSNLVRVETLARYSLRS